MTIEPWQKMKLCIHVNAYAMSVRVMHLKTNIMQLKHTDASHAFFKYTLTLTHQAGK